LKGSNTVEIWGSGKPRREFTFVTDVAEWISEKLANLKEFPERLNIGLGRDNSVKEFYEFAAEAVGYEGEFEFNTNMPDGIFSKLMDSSIASSKFDWSPTTSVAEGMELTYKWWRGTL
jgi:GDP-L-fucose synthase